MHVCVCVYVAAFAHAQLRVLCLSICLHIVVCLLYHVRVHAGLCVCSLVPTIMDNNVTILSMVLLVIIMLNHRYLRKQSTSYILAKLSY